MKVFFDVDLTLLNSSGAEWVLRPGAGEVLAGVVRLGHDVYLWSATGQQHAQRVVETFGLQRWVTDCLEKDSNPTVRPDLVVDDDSFLVEKYSGVCVRPYREPDPADRELYRVLEAVTGWDHPARMAP
ncbi:MAG: hypothetical protein HY683_03145 [Chloroflexi bacterium]|nr:hypothetical protein [Chloroflexota bacterium]